MLKVAMTIDTEPSKKTGGYTLIISLMILMMLMMMMYNYTYAQSEKDGKTMELCLKLQYSEATQISEVSRRSYKANSHWWMLTDKPTNFTTKPRVTPHETKKKMRRRVPTWYAAVRCNCEAWEVKRFWLSRNSFCKHHASFPQLLVYKANSNVAFDVF